MPPKVSLRILADEMIHRRIVNAVKKDGHDITCCPKGLKNGAVYQLIQAEKRILMTQDKDFSDAKRYPPEPTDGILSIRVLPPSIANVLSTLEKFLAGKSSAEFKGKLSVVE